LERTTGRAAKANGKSERTVKNIRMDFTGPEVSGGNVLMPRRIQHRTKEAQWMISKSALFPEIFRTL
jgi:hypothetical protein